MARASLRFHTAVFLLLGGSFVVLGVVGWLRDRSGVDAWLAGVGGLVMLIGVGWWVAFRRVFRA